MEQDQQCLHKKQGFDVFVSDKGQIKDKYREILDKHNIRWEEGNHNEDDNSFCR